MGLGTERDRECKGLSEVGAYSAGLPRSAHLVHGLSLFSGFPQNYLPPTGTPSKSDKMWALFWNAPRHQQSVILSMLSAQGLCGSLIQRRGLNLPLCSLQNYAKVPGKQSPNPFYFLLTPCYETAEKARGCFLLPGSRNVQLSEVLKQNEEACTHHPCSPIPQPLPLRVQCYQNTSPGSVPTYHFQTFPERVQERRKEKRKRKPFPLALFTVVGGGGVLPGTTYYH